MFDCKFQWNKTDFRDAESIMTFKCLQLELVLQIDFNFDAKICRFLLRMIFMFKLFAQLTFTYKR